MSRISVDAVALAALLEQAASDLEQCIAEFCVGTREVDNTSAERTREITALGQRPCHCKESA